MLVRMLHGLSTMTGIPRLGISGAFTLRRGEILDVHDHDLAHSWVASGTAEPVETDAPPTDEKPAKRKRK